MRPLPPVPSAGGWWPERAGQGSAKASVHEFGSGVQHMLAVVQQPAETRPRRSGDQARSNTSGSLIPLPMRVQRAARVGKISAPSASGANSTQTTPPSEILLCERSTSHCQPRRAHPACPDQCHQAGSVSAVPDLFPPPALDRSESQGTGRPRGRRPGDTEPEGRERADAGKGRSVSAVRARIS
jgi:hypothetical protein